MDKKEIIKTLSEIAHLARGARDIYAITGELSKCDDIFDYIGDLAVDVLDEIREEE